MSSALKAWVRAMEMTAPIARHPTRTLPIVIDELADRFESAPALLSQEARLSYRELAEASHRYARWALSEGLHAGDVVGLLMPNCPDYMAVWLGLTRIGVTVALLNTHLRGEVLAHSIRIVAPRCVIFDAALSEALRTAHPHMDASNQWRSPGPRGPHNPPARSGDRAPARR